MEIEKIKLAFMQLEKLESVQSNLKELSKSDAVDKIVIRRKSCGASQYSYEVEINDDSEFLKTIKCLITDHLIRKEKRILDDIERL